MPNNPNRPQRTPSPGFRKRTPAAKQQGKPEVTPKVEDTSARDAAHTAKLSASLATKYSCELASGQLKVNDSTVRVSYLNEEAGVAFEIYPKQGGLNSGIKRKVTADLLKLALLKKHWAASHGDKASCGIILGDQDSLDDFLGKKGPSWMRRAAEEFGVEVITL